MLLKARKRRQILKVVLPLLVAVWAVMPALPCCQAVAALDTEHHSGAHGAHNPATHGSHAVVGHLMGHAAHESAGTTLDSADLPSTDAPCPDVDKNHQEARALASVDVAPAIVVFILPIAADLAHETVPLGEPPPPIQRRPLHLSKSVLLI